MNLKNISYFKNLNINKIINYYVSVFASYLLLTRIVFFMHITGDMFNKIISTILAIAGFIFVLYKIIKDFKYFQDKFIISLFILFIAACISTILNIKYGLFSNLKMLVWVFIHFFLLFSLTNYSKDDYQHAFYTIGIPILSIMFICCFISLLQFFMDITYTINLADYPRVQGFYGGRLFGVFDDPNYASIASISAAAFSLFFAKSASSKKNKIFFYFNIIIQVSYVILSNSRTGFIGLIICSIVYAYYKTSQLSVDRKNHLIKKCVVFFMTFSTFVVCLLCLREFYAYCPNIIHKEDNVVEKNADNNSVNVSDVDVEDSKESNTDDDIKQENNSAQENNIEQGNNPGKENSIGQNNSIDQGNILERKDVEADFSNNRFDIWRGALEVSRDKRVFGVSPRNLIPYAKGNFPYSYTAQTGYETHNGYLSVFVSTGYFGTIPLILFISFCILDLIKKINKNCFSLQSTVCYMIIATMAFSTIMLQDVFFMNTATTVIFWRILGLNIYGKELE